MRAMGGASAAKPGEENLDARLRAFDLDGHAIGVVADKPASRSRGDADRRKAESHTLHHSAHAALPGAFAGPYRVGANAPPSRPLQTSIERLAEKV